MPATLASGARGRRFGVGRTHRRYVALRCLREPAQSRAEGCDHSVSRKMSRKAGLGPSQFDAVAFDLDGGVTDTARSQFRAWKQTFDASFVPRSRREGVAPAPCPVED